jgi:peroxiredoxin
MKSYLIILIMIFLISCASKERQCTISGKIIGEKKEALVLFKASKFPHIEAEIPIKNNSFSYVLQFQYPEVYELTFKDDFNQGSMMLTSFFAEDGNIKIEIKYGGKSKDNKVTGLLLNDELNNYRKLQLELFWDEVMKYSDSIMVMAKNGTYLSEEAKNLDEKTRNTKNDSLRKILYNERRYLENTKKDYTPEARRFIDIQDSIMNRKKLWEFDYIEKNTTLISYYIFLENIKETVKSCCWQPVDIELTNKAQSNLYRYIKAFPDHPYNEIIQNSINGLLNIHRGGRFIDFSLPDINGQNVSLSKVIKKNKLTLLDFWSTWCGPCLKTSKELIPIYEQYKNKGFEILGITQAYGKSDDLLNFIKKHKYPWPNVIDKDSKNGLWDKYNLSQQAGGVFLINASGQIIEVNLTADKIKEKLDEILK